LVIEKKLKKNNLKNRLYLQIKVKILKELFFKTPKQIPNLKCQHSKRESKKKKINYSGKVYKNMLCRLII